MKRDYLSSLRCWARWYLPPEEAAEVLEDYRDLAAERSEQELRQDMGTPRAAARQLVQPGAYGRWLAVFAVLAVSVGLPAIVPLWQELALEVFLLFQVYWFWDIGQTVVPFTWVFFAAGMTLSLVWFGCGRKGPDRTLPRQIPPLLVLLAAGMAFLWFMAWLLLEEPHELVMRLFPTHERVRVMRLAMTLDCFIMGVIGLFGLVKSRISSRRWGAVYVLGLAGTILGLAVWALMTSMDLSVTTPGWQTAYILRYALVTLLGLLGTAVSLC